jgi:hypothetical protein
MADHSPKWVELMSNCLSAVERDQIGSPCPVVDHEVIPDLSGGPDEMGVWCICRTEEEKRLFSDTELSRFVSLLKKKMLRVGFPDTAVASLMVKATSRTEVEAGGGRFQSFR